MRVHKPPKPFIPKPVRFRVPVIRPSGDSYNVSENVGQSSDMTTVNSSSSDNGLYTSYSATHDSPSYIKAVNSVVGVKNPKWRDQIRRGVSATTTCSGTKYLLERSYITQGSTHYAFASPHIHTRREWYGFPPVTLPAASVPNGSTVTNVHNRLLRKWYDAISQARSSVESGQDFGEYRETVEGLRRPMHSMRNLILGYYSKLRKLKNVYRRNPVSLPKALADSYLEWTFGWHPLALDVADAYVGLRNRSKFLAEAPVHAHAKDIYAGSSSFYNPTGLPQPVTCQKTVQSSYKESVKGAVRINLVKGTLPVLDVLQLHTVQDFVTTAWDLLPYSFLVDYFTNVGDFIRAATACQHDVVWSNWTTRTESTESYQYTITGTSIAPGTGRQEDNWLYGGNSTQKVTSFTRSTAPPNGVIPSLRFSLPMSDKPWENIAALVIGGSLPLVPFFKRR